MKKLMLIVFLFLSAFIWTGCYNADAGEFMSEHTKIVFAGEGAVGQCLISVGEREDPYIVDGIHTTNTGFSLVVFKPSVSLQVSDIDVVLVVDGESNQMLLELNPVNMTYIGDLGYSLGEDSDLSVIFQNETIVMSDVSKNFATTHQDAIKQGFNVVKEECFFEKEEKYECYLKIIEGERFGGTGYFWCYTVITQTRSSKNVLINALTGEIFLG